MCGMNAVLIVENRPHIDAKKILRDHKKYLSDDWETLWDPSPSIKSASDYNRLLTSENFWRKLIKYDRVLICQHDSGLLREGIEEFMKWSYVGAPWKVDAPWNPGQGGNGGLSLRCPKESLRTIQIRPYDPKWGNEDCWFSRFMDGVAPRSVCQQFSVETEFKLGTLGYHAISKYLSDKECQLIISQYGKRQ